MPVHNKSGYVKTHTREAPAVQLWASHRCTSYAGFARIGGVAGKLRGRPPGPNRLGLERQRSCTRRVKMAELHSQADRPRRPAIHAERGRTRMRQNPASSIRHLQDDDDDVDEFDDEYDEEEDGDEDDESEEDDDEESWQVARRGVRQAEG